MINIYCDVTKRRRRTEKNTMRFKARQKKAGKYFKQQCGGKMLQMDTKNNVRQLISIVTWYKTVT